MKRFSTLSSSGRFGAKSSGFPFEFDCRICHGNGKEHLSKPRKVRWFAMGPGAMQKYVIDCDVRSWRASGVMFDKTHCDRCSNNDWLDPLLVVVDEYLVDFVLKDKGVVEQCLRSCPRQVQEVELETFTSRSWSKGEWTDGRDTCVCSGKSSVLSWEQTSAVPRL